MIRYIQQAVSIEYLTDLGAFSAVDKIFLREPNSLTQVSLTNRIPGEKAFLNLTAARAATFKHGRIKRGVDRLAPGYTVPSYQKGYL